MLAGKMDTKLNIPGWINIGKDAIDRTVTIYCENKLVGQWYNIQTNKERTNLCGQKKF